MPSSHFLSPSNYPDFILMSHPHPIFCLPFFLSLFIIIATSISFPLHTHMHTHRGLIQDHVASGVKMTCKDTFLTKREFQQLLYVAVCGLPGTRTYIPHPFFLSLSFDVCYHSISYATPLLYPVYFHPFSTALFISPSILSSHVIALFSCLYSLSTISFFSPYLLHPPLPSLPPSIFLIIPPLSSLPSSLPNSSSPPLLSLSLSLSLSLRH